MLGKKNIYLYLETKKNFSTITKYTKVEKKKNKNSFNIIIIIMLH